MKHFLFTLFTLLLFTVIACQNDNRERMHNEVMVIHDEAMAKLGQIKSAHKKLKTRIDQDTLMTDSLRNIILSKMSLLKSADNAMMDWMANYKKPKEDVTKEEAIKYLVDQKDKISEVAEMMYKSIREGESVLIEQ